MSTPYFIYTRCPYLPCIFVQKKMYETPPGIPIHNSIAISVPCSKQLTVKEQATYNMASGTEIYPRIVCATFQVS